MLIDYVELTNFRMFQGPTRLDFTTTPQKTVVLIGADNGTGKTSILNGISLCLYGRRCADLWTGGQTGFRSYVSENFNNPAFSAGERTCSLELGLTISELQIKRKLRVRRSFQLTDNRKFLTDNQESLEVWIDGRPHDLPATDVPGADPTGRYEELLRVLIPTNIAQFYFFDGERVREMFHRFTSENISQAIRDLLGLTYYERLAEDLKNYRRSRLPQQYGRHSQTVAALTQKQGERTLVEGKRVEIEGRLRDLQESLAEIDTSLEKKHREFVQMGGIHQAELDTLNDQLSSLELEYDNVANALKSAVTDHIAGCFLMGFQEAFANRTAKEQVRKDWETKRKTIEPHVQTLTERLFGEAAPASRPPLDANQLSFYAQRTAEEIKKLFWPPPADATSELWFDLRDSEVDAVGRQFSESSLFSRGTLKEMVDQKARLYVERRKIQERIGSTGSSGLTAEISVEIRTLTEEGGSLRARINDSEQDISHHVAKLAEIDREITNLSADCQKSEKGQAKEKLTKKVEEAVAEYLQAATGRRLAEVEQHLNQLFAQVINAPDLVRRIRIKPDTYELVIFDSEDRERPIENILSAGQAQVLAMAFVAALAKASRRVLPFIVDTPLGRLDPTHRRQLTEHFLVGQSPQTILLSTPTEINNCVYNDVPLHLFDLLEPHVARVYTLIKQGAQKTKAEPHYFGRKLAQGASHG